MRTKLILVIVLLSCSLAYSQENEGYIVRTGDMAPDFVINEAGGKSYRLSSLRGNVVMLQFTASWCSVCRQEMPFIEKEIWQLRKKAGLIVVG
ncbi:MAG: redoxin domain-containing protein, partial [Bacteroidales bacterium]